MIDPREFRNTLGRFATGITVVTMRQGDVSHGITVNAFMSLSLDPALVAIAIDKRANAHQTLLESEHYAVSILNHEQEHLSNHFAGRPTPGIEDPLETFHDFPVVEGALAHLLCRIEDVYQGGDHTIFVGRVERLAYRDGGVPLLYYQGKYADVGGMELTE